MPAMATPALGDARRLLGALVACSRAPVSALRARAAHLDRFATPASTLPCRWLAAQARDAGAAWQRLRGVLERELGEPRALDDAVDAARAAFATVALGAGVRGDDDRRPDAARVDATQGDAA
jgi:hypothetical protein